MSKDKITAVPYELTRTIRFRLEPMDLNYANNLKLILSQEGDVDKLFQQCQNISDFFVNIFLYRKEDIFHTNKGDGGRSVDCNIIFRRKRIIKYSWLRTYTKNSFHDWIEKINDKKKEYDLTDVTYLNKEFERWINEWDDLVQHLQYLLNQPEEGQKRKRDFAAVIRGLIKWENFEYIKEFVFSVKDTQVPEIDKNIQLFRSCILETEENLKKCEKSLLSSQSAGVLIAKATLNYYTLNKTPKEYSDLREEEDKKLNKQIKDFTQNNKSMFSFDCKFDFGENPNNWTLEEAYNKIKEWKAEQKSKFINDVSSNKIHINNFREKYPLFNSTDEAFNKYCHLSKEIQELANRNNNGENGLCTEIKTQRQERGKFFNAPGNRDNKGREIVVTENYKKLCELYKKIALCRGQIKARVKGLEAEKVDARRMEYWALIMEMDNTRFLMLIPRAGGENHTKAKTFIENRFGRGERECTLYHFKSLTFRALWKLCFKGENNTFLSSVMKELNIFGKNASNELVQGLQHKQLPSFYQKVLKTKVAKNQLSLVDFGGLSEVLDKDYNEDIDSFISDLEKTCYVKIPLALSRQEKDRFIKDYNAKVFEITSQDLRIANDEESERNKNQYKKAHTKMWNSFWIDTNEANRYGVRLNPEMGITYREANVDLQWKIKSGGFAQPKHLSEYKNRYAYEQFTLATTITLNAAEKKSNLALKTSDDIAIYIDEFNQTFNKNFDGQWHYGIDRGLKELATLCIVKPSDTNYEIQEEKYAAPEFALVEVWILKNENIIAKDEKGRERLVIKNISYFINREDLFKKKVISCIDLTIAKLIGGKIVLNGDKETYLRLKELSVKRRVFELFSRGEINMDSEILMGKNTLRILKKDGVEKYLYWFTEEQKKSNQSKVHIKEMIQSYLKGLSTTNIFEDVDTVEKINNLRDAITANMVGIIAHLQQKFPGRIALENMELDKHIEKHSEQSNENISRRLEWALYRKFQTEGLVPPQIRQSVISRNFLKGKQFGIVHFVKIDMSSQTCPRCNTKGNQGEKRKNRFTCANNSCGFVSQDKRFEFESLNNSDKIAAYNIANSIYESNIKDND